MAKNIRSGMHIYVMNDNGVLITETVAHAVLAPMRWWYGIFGVSKESNELIGVHWFAKMLYEMTTFLIPSIIHI
jgi:hypothetical protein